ncbi:Y_Y_Y domain-containing protein [Arachidicoccus rhizosphaerae]|uniref:Y_Y_Y domain-containing protein n=1 Tax=Arachidicoccus rhizosphaerae TaxID=551991 RepID=A0A1H3YFH2_9BACT|nr:triple tyrosine motif-containing protein [Arachidicoccus rhizosphaerae]SEA10297.1 Y_Y_Y domain-containing protein [Arachidicoccus rhizosphaerae]
MKLNFLNNILKRVFLLTNSRRTLHGWRLVMGCLFLLGVVSGKGQTGTTYSGGPADVSMGAGTIGLPAVVHFSEKDFEAGVQNWMITQDSLGILYFANTEGLLTYNGNDWHLFPLPNKTLVRSIHVSSGGRIFTGGQDEIGYYFPDANGKLGYHSLKSYLPKNQQSFADVWNTGTAQGRIYFRCTDRIMAIDTALGQRRSVVYPAPSEWLYMACVQDGILAQDKKQGLLKYSRGKWTVIAPTAFKDQVITAILTMGRDRYLITTLKHGVYLLEAGRVTAVTLPAEIPQAHIYAAAGIKREPTQFVLGTTSKGVYIISLTQNPSGKPQAMVVRHFTSESRLQNNNVLSLFVDQEHNLWLGLDKGIDLVDYNSFIQTISPVHNTPAACYTAIIDHHQLIIGTSDGLYKTDLSVPVASDISYSRGAFTKVSGSSGQVWGLYSTGQHLLMGHNEGAFEIKGNSAEPIYRQEGVWLFQVLPHGSIQDGPWISGNYAGMELLKDSAGRMVDGGRVAGSPFESLRFMAMDTVRHVVFASHPYRGVYGLQMTSDMKTVNAVRLYTQKDGLPGTLNNYVYTLHGKIVFCTDNGLYQYDAERDRFFPDSSYQDIFGQMSLRLVQQDSAGRIWFVSHKKLGVVLKDRTIQYFPELTGKLISGFEFILPVNDKNVLVGSNDGLIHINIDKYQAGRQKVQLLLTRVTATAQTDSSLFNGYFTTANRVVKSQSEDKIAQLPARYNSFHFTFTATSYRPPREFEYSYELEGFDKGWSSWNAKKEKDYTNLPYGSYTFKVRAKDRFGVESQVVQYQFVILPHWYQTKLAYLIYLLLFFMALIYGRYVMQRKFEAQRIKFEKEQEKMRYLHQLEIEHNEREIIQLQKEKLQAEVSFKNQELASTTMHLFKRGKLLAKLKEELLEAIKALPDHNNHADFGKLVKMINEAEKQDADWEQFAIHFDEVHNNFLANLKSQYPELTPADLKICAYIKMNLSSKEMAQLLNISLKGVEVARYRLRKKLGIPGAQTSLYDFLSSVTGNMAVGLPGGHLSSDQFSPENEPTGES